MSFYRYFWFKMTMPYHWIMMRYNRAGVRYYIWRMGLSTRGKNWNDVHSRVDRMKSFVAACESQGNTREQALAFIQHSHIEWRSWIMDLPIRRRHWWESLFFD